MRRIYSFKDLLIIFRRPNPVVASNVGECFTNQRRLSIGFIFSNYFKVIKKAIKSLKSLTLSRFTNPSGINELEASP